MSVLAFAMLIAATVLLLLGAYSFMSAFGIIRVKLPAIFTDYSKSYAVDAYIWDELVPATARRWYLVPMVAGTLGAAFMGVFLFIQGERIGALFPTGVFLLGTAHTTTRWFRYRSRL